jgi:hypothetical protein
MILIVLNLRVMLPQREREFLKFVLKDSTDENSDHYRPTPLLKNPVGCRKTPML